MTRSCLLGCVLAATCLTAVPAHAGHEYVATEADFRCLTDGVRAQGMNFYISHRSRRQRAKAVAKTKRGKLGKGYPVGTVLQLLPFEAMVKRGGRFNPEGHGWEYFRLSVTAAGTAIAARGGADVANVIGSCQGCHESVAPAHDAVCEFVIGASGLGLTNEQLAAIQAADPRCRK